MAALRVGYFFFFPLLDFVTSWGLTGIKDFLAVCIFVLDELILEDEEVVSFFDVKLDACGDWLESCWGAGLIGTGGCTFGGSGGEGLVSAKS